MLLLTAAHVAQVETPLEAMTRDPADMSESDPAAWAASLGADARRRIQAALLAAAERSDGRSANGARASSAASTSSEMLACRLRLISSGDQDARRPAPMRPMASRFAVFSAIAKSSHTRGGRTGATTADPVTMLATDPIRISE